MEAKLPEPWMAKTGVLLGPAADEAMALYPRD